MSDVDVEEMDKIEAEYSENEVKGCSGEHLSAKFWDLSPMRVLHCRSLCKFIDMNGFFASRFIHIKTWVYGTMVNDLYDECNPNEYSQFVIWWETLFLKHDFM